MPNMTRIDASEEGTEIFPQEYQKTTLVPSFVPDACVKPLQMDNATVKRLQAIDYRLEFDEYLDSKKANLIPDQNGQSMIELESKLSPDYVSVHLEKSKLPKLPSKPLGNKQNPATSHPNAVDRCTGMKNDRECLKVDPHLINSWLQGLAHGSRSAFAIGEECLTVTGHEFHESTKFALSELQFASDVFSNLAVPQATIALDAVHQSQERHRHIHELFEIQQKVLNIVIHNYRAEHNAWKAMSQASKIEQMVADNVKLQQKVERYMKTIDTLQVEMKEILGFNQESETGGKKRRKNRKHKAKASGVDIRLLELYEDMILHASVDDYEILHGDTMVLRADRRGSQSPTKRGTTVRAKSTVSDVVVQATITQKRPTEVQATNNTSADPTQVVGNVAHTDEEIRIDDEPLQHRKSSAGVSLVLAADATNESEKLDNVIGTKGRKTAYGEAIKSEVLKVLAPDDILDFLKTFMERNDMYVQASIVVKALEGCDESALNEVARQLSRKKRGVVLGSLIGAVKANEMETVGKQVHDAATTPKDVIPLIASFMVHLAEGLQQKVIFDSVQDLITTPKQLEDLKLILQELEVKVHGPDGETKPDNETNSNNSASLLNCSSNAKPENTEIQVQSATPTFVSDFAYDLDILSLCCERLTNNGRLSNDVTQVPAGVNNIVECEPYSIDVPNMPKPWKRMLQNRKHLKRRKSSRCNYGEMLDTICSHLVGKVYAKHISLVRYSASHQQPVGESGESSSKSWAAVSTKSIPKLSRAAVQFCLEEYGIDSIAAEHLSSLWGVVKTYHTNSKRVFQMALLLGSVGAPTFTPILNKFAAYLLGNTTDIAHVEHLFTHGEGFSYITKLQAMNAIKHVLMSDDKGNVDAQSSGREDSTEDFVYRYPIPRKLLERLHTSIESCVVTRSTALQLIAEGGKADPVQVLMKPGPGGDDEALIQVDDFLACTITVFMEKLQFDQQLVQASYSAYCERNNVGGPVDALQLMNLLNIVQPNCAPNREQASELYAIICDNITLRNPTGDVCDDQLAQASSFKTVSSDRAFSSGLATLYAASGAVRDYSCFQDDTVLGTAVFAELVEEFCKRREE